MSLLISSIKVLLVDDHPVVREGLRTVLRAEPGIELVGEAASGLHALNMMEVADPQVVLLDIQLPGMSGLETLREIKRRAPHVAVVMLTMYDSEVYFAEAVRLGANGYLLKDSPQELISLAIRAAGQGGMVIPPRLFETAMRLQMDVPAKPVDRQLQELTSNLTPRECDVLRLLARGYPNRAISDEMHLAEVTVKKYVQSLVGKLGVPDRTHAALLAARLGLADPGVEVRDQGQP